MPRDPAKTALYHITSIENLPAIAHGGYILSDARLVDQPHEVIGYSNIEVAPLV